MAEILYKQAQAPGAGPAPGQAPTGEAGGKGDDVIDAEFSEDK
jgi:hypothetical protein